MADPVSRERLEALIPHAGPMCLLDRVLDWDADRIRCATQTHRAADHPLRRDGQLAAVHLAEYGAQAMAVHGGLCAASGAAGAPGLLVTVRDLRLSVARIDDVVPELVVTARRLVANAAGRMYAFDVAAGGRPLASGRVGVLTATPGTPLD